MKFEHGDRVKLSFPIDNWFNPNTGKLPYTPNGLPQMNMVYFVDRVTVQNGETGVTLLGFPLYENGESMTESAFSAKFFDNLTKLKAS